MEYFGKAGLNGQTAKLTTVKQVREIGSAVLTCEDLSNWATDTPVFFATYKVDIDTQKIVPNSQINWRGKVNVENNTIIEIQADSDTPDKGNAIGDIVECLPTAGWANSLVDGISVIHKQDGTLKANVVKGENIDFASFKNGSIEPGKLKNIDVITGTANTRRDSEQTWTQNVWQKKNGSDLTFTTTQPNQKVILLASLQFFQGGYSQARWKVDNNYTNIVQFRSEIAVTTTASQTLMIVYAVPNAGVHNASLEISAGGSLRIIDGEGSSNYAVIPAFG